MVALPRKVAFALLILRIDSSYIRPVPTRQCHPADEIYLELFFRNHWTVDIWPAMVSEDPSIACFSESRDGPTPTLSPHEKTSDPELLYRLPFSQVVGLKRTTVWARTECKPDGSGRLDCDPATQCHAKPCSADSTVPDNVLKIEISYSSGVFFFNFKRPTQDPGLANAIPVMIERYYSSSNGNGNCDTLVCNEHECETDTALICPVEDDDEETTKGLTGIRKLRMIIDYTFDKGTRNLFKPAN